MWSGLNSLSKQQILPFPSSTIIASSSKFLDSISTSSNFSLASLVSHSLTPHITYLTLLTTPHSHTSLSARAARPFCTSVHSSLSPLPSALSPHPSALSPAHLHHSDTPLDALNTLDHVRRSVLSSPFVSSGDSSQSDGSADVRRRRVYVSNGVSGCAWTWTFVDVDERTGSERDGDVPPAWLSLLQGPRRSKDRVVRASNWAVDSARVVRNVKRWDGLLLHFKTNHRTTVIYDLRLCSTYVALHHTTHFTHVIARRLGESMYQCL